MFKFISDFFSRASASHQNSLPDRIDPGFFHQADDVNEPLNTYSHDSLNSHSINPANGLPMISGDCGMDVAGNMYGFDHSMEDTFSSSFQTPFPLEVICPQTGVQIALAVFPMAFEAGLSANELMDWQIFPEP